LKKIVTSILILSMFWNFNHLVLAQAENNIQTEEGRIIKIRDPINKNDVATKNYVDNKVEGIESPPVVLQTEGQSETAVMSQKAVTTALEEAVKNSVKNPSVSNAIDEKIEEATKGLVNIRDIFNMIYPVGSIYMSVNSVNPSSAFGGTWVSWGSGRVPVGVDASDYNFNSVEKTGGSSEHRHDWRIALHWFYGEAGGEGAWNSTGAYVYSGNRYDGWARELDSLPVIVNANTSEAHKTINAGGKFSQGDTSATSTLQPYITCYMWKRIA